MRKLEDVVDNPRDGETMVRISIMVRCVANLRMNEEYLHDDEMYHWSMVHNYRVVVIEYWEQFCHFHYDHE